MRTNGNRRTQRVTRNQRNGVDFKIHQNEIGKYSTAGIDVSNVRAGYLDKFTEEEIEKAKELKAKQLALYNADPANRTQPEYTDEFYLDYARSLTRQNVLGRMREIYKNRSSRYEINDMYWAQYSYEEIIQMENDGYNIPQNVLEWAHAQQQSDITDYIVLADSSETDDSSLTSDSTSSDQLSQYRAQALNDIAKIEKAENETAQQVEKYQDAEKQAKLIQKHQEDSYKEEFAKINEMTKEWKELNDKQQAGEKLSKKEEKRLKQLSGLLNGENGKITTKIEADASDMDDFLLTMNLLNEKIDKNNIIVSETVQNATALSEIDKQYNPSKLPFVDKGIRIDGNGPSLNTLYGIRVEDIAETAIKKSNDLNELSVKTVNRLSGDKSENLINFATEYSNQAHQLNQNTKDTMGDKFGEETPDNMSQDDKYMVLPVFSAANSVIATATSLMAETDMFSAQKLTEKQQKEVNKQLKKAQKEVKDLEQESNTSAAEHEQNLSEEEQFLLELEQLNSSENDNIQSAPATQSNSTIQTVQSASQMSEQDDEATENTKENNETLPLENTQNTSKGTLLKSLVFKNDDEVQNEDNTSKKTSILENINNVANNDGKIATRIEKLAQKGISANNKTMGLVNALGNITDNFEESRKTAQKVSAVTSSVGIGTALLGHGHMLEGVALISEGTLLQSSLNPFTAEYGLKLIHSGNVLTGLGVAETVTGTMATGTGLGVLATSTAAKPTTTDAKLTEKTTIKAIEANQNSIMTSEKAVGIEPTNNNTQTTTGESSQPAENGENPQEIPAVAQIPQNDNSIPETKTVLENETPEITSVMTGAVSDNDVNFAAANEVPTITDKANSEVLEADTQNNYYIAAPKTEEIKDTEDIKDTGKTDKIEENKEEKETENSPITNKTEGSVELSKIDEVKNSKETAETEDTKNPQNEQKNDESTIVAVRDNGSTQMVASSNVSTNTEKADNEKKQENENNKADDKSSNGQQQSQNGYSIEKDFSIPDSINAIAKMTKATGDVTAASTLARSKGLLFRQRIQYMEQLNKNIEKNRTQVESAIQLQTSRVAQANAKIEVENQRIIEASEIRNMDEIVEAQANIKNIQAQVIENSGDKQISQQITNIDKINNASKTAQAGQVDLKNNTSDLEKKIDQQLKASVDTMLVGTGTVGVGTAHSIPGTSLFMGGQALVASAGPNFSQMALGLNMMTNGAILNDVETLENVTGLAAIATGSVGAAANATAQVEKAVVDSTEKVGKTFLSMIRGSNSKETADIQEMQKQQAQITENISVVAASASANVDTTNIVETDDKAERKLVRFNKETELLSRKKRKKVNAVSSSSRG